MTEDSEEICYNCGKKVSKGVAFCEECVRDVYQTSSKEQSKKNPSKFTLDDEEKEPSKVTLDDEKEILKVKARYSDLEFLSFESAYEVAELGNFIITDKKIMFRDERQSISLSLKLNEINQVEPRKVNVKVRTGFLKSKQQEKLISFLIKTKNGNHVFFFDTLPENITMEKIIKLVHSK